MSFVLRIILSIIFCCQFKFSQAQETMITEISYVYLDTLIKTAKENYPRVKIFDKKITNAKNNVDKAKISWFDALTASYLYNPNNSFNVAAPSFFSGFQVGVSLNIGQLLQKPYQIKNAKNDLSISTLEKEEYDLNITGLVKERYFLYVQQQTILKSITLSAQDAENILKMVRYKFERGEETLLNYNNASIIFSNQNQQKIAAEAALLIAKARLEEIIGKKLEDIK